MSDSFSFDTLAVRAGIERSQFGEHAEPIYLTSSFVFENSAQAAARFAGTDRGPVYSRFSNPTVQMFCDRLAALEGAPACLATASGMSAIMATLMSLTRAGDRAAVWCSGHSHTDAVSQRCRGRHLGWCALEVSARAVSGQPSLIRCTVWRVDGG